MCRLRQRAGYIQQSSDHSHMQRLRCDTCQTKGRKSRYQRRSGRGIQLMSRAREFPENGELVVCSVTNVKNFGAFVTRDEYDGKEGFIHVRDIASGWVKYVRDFIREGQKVVCKVLGVD